MSKPVVLVSAPIHQDGLDMLAEVFEVRHTYHLDASQDEIDEALSDADAVVVRSVPITAAALANSPKMKVIAKHGAGLDSVDVDAATELGIVVANSGDANAGSVAEHAVALMLAVLHDVPAVDRRYREGAYTRPGSLSLGDLSEAVVGLVGFGNIARRVAVMCANGFGATVLAYDPMVSADEMASVGVQKVDDLADLLPQCDVVSVHVPLTPDTRNLIDAAALKLMKPDAVLVNTARGGIVDEAALLESLAAGHLRGAGLDVLEQEPAQPGNPILDSELVVVSPHIAGGTELARKRMARAAARAAIDVVQGRRPTHLINTSVLGHARAELEGESR